MQAQPAELAKEDDDWYRPKDRGKETQGQRLARIVAEETRINTTTDKELTE